MKYILSFLLFTFSVISYSQTKDISAEIIKINGDTIQTNIRVVVNIFNENLLNELSVTNKVQVIDKNGEKVNIPAKEIKKLIFTDFFDKQRIFVNDKKKLKEMIYENILKCYIYYFPNPHDGSNVQRMEFYDENGKRVKTPPFTTSIRTLKKTVKEKPELLEIIEKPGFNNDRIKLVLKKYEDNYLITNNTIE